VEALAASLAVCGWHREASELLNPFSYGPTFLSLNSDTLSRYSDCKDARDVFFAQAKLLHEARERSSTRGDRSTEALAMGAGKGMLPITDAVASAAAAGGGGDDGDGGNDEDGDYEADEAMGLEVRRDVAHGDDDDVPGDAGLEDGNQDDGDDEDGPGNDHDA